MDKVEIKADNTVAFLESNKTDKPDIEHDLFHRFFVGFVWNGLCHLSQFILESYCSSSFIQERHIRISEGNERLNRLDALKDVSIDEFYVDSDNEMDVDVTTNIHSLKNEIKVDFSVNSGVSVFTNAKNQDGYTEKVEIGKFEATKLDSHLISKLDDISEVTSLKYFESLLNIKLTTT